MPSNNQPPVTKRVHYFNGQTLGIQDYIDEQEYHIDRQRRPYQFLHVYGICNGSIPILQEGKRTRSLFASFNRE